MPQLRIRKPFAAAFAVLCLLSAYLGLSTQKIPSYGQSDKGLHFVTFFLLTLTFYWILETSRRRLIHLTLLTCTAGLAIGSEIIQALLPNGRAFDPFDILANVVGSALALAACAWYHRRMLERRRKNKNYDIVPGDDEVDVELGEGARQETGTISGDEQAGAGATEGGGRTVTEELDDWDENAEDEDWDQDDGIGNGKADDGKNGDAVAAGGEGDSKKRAD